MTVNCVYFGCVKEVKFSRRRCWPK